MKNLSLLTLLSASLAVAAPAPFVGTGPVVAAGTENVVLPATHFGLREAAIVEDFSKRALKLRGALLAARGGKGNGNANAEANADDAAVVDDEAQLQEDAPAAEEVQGKGKGKNAQAQAGMSLLRSIMGFLY